MSLGEVLYNITNNESCGYKRLGMGWLRTWRVKGGYAGKGLWDDGVRESSA